MNNMPDKNGLVSSLPILGIELPFPIVSSQKPSQKKETEVQASALMQMRSVIAKRRVEAAPKLNVSHSVENAG